MIDMLKQINSRISLSWPRLAMGRLRPAALGLTAAAAAVTLAFVPAHAKYSQRVRSACTDDYLRFCPHYDEGSPKLRSCMRAYGKSLSPQCVRALMDAGLVSRKEVARRSR